MEITYSVLVVRNCRKDLVHKTRLVWCKADECLICADELAD